MSQHDELYRQLGTALAKFLLKSVLGIPSDLSNTIVDLVAERIGDSRTQREAVRQFESLGDMIADRIRPTLDAAEERGVDTNPVIKHLAQAWQGKLSDRYFVAADLDPGKLTQAIRRVYKRPTELTKEQQSVYDLALVQSARYVVEIAPTLPGFQGAIGTETLRRLSRLTDGLERLLDTVQRIEQGVATNAADASARFEADYRQSVIRTLDRMELFGADIPVESRHHSLSDAYVSLNIQSSHHDDVSGAAISASSLLDHVLVDQGRLLIRGDAGSGKSTLFRWIAVRCAAASPRRSSEKEFISYGRQLRDDRIFDGQGQLLEEMKGMLTLHGYMHEKHDWQRRIPVYIRLRDCPDGRIPSPDLIPGLTTDKLRKAPNDWMASLLASGRCLCLLDGVDEVPGRFRETKLLAQIEDLVQLYPDNYFVVSTRPTAVPPNWLASQGFHEASIVPMTERQKSSLIDRWHFAVAEEVRRRGDSGSGLEQLAERLKSKLSDNPAVNRLASYPLLCAMICALHRDRNEQLPINQLQLCEVLCDMLLERREQESGVADVLDSKTYALLSYHEKRRIVQDLAYFMTLNEESAVTTEVAVGQIAASLASLPQHSRQHANLVCRELIERSGMLREASPGRIDFVHNTFREFLAGERIGDDGGVGLLCKHADAPAWAEVLLFAAGTRKRGFTTKLIRRLLEPAAIGSVGDANSQQEQVRARRLLAVRCRSVALDLEPELQVHLESVAEEMFPPRTMSDAEALATNGNTVVPFLKRKGRMKAPHAAASIRALRMIGTAGAHRAIEAYLTDDRRTVINELLQAVNPLVIPSVRQSVITKRELLGGTTRDWKRERGIRSQINDLTPLANDQTVTTLDLRWTSVEDITPLRECSQLTDLDLGYTPLQSISGLQDLSALERLSVSNSRVTDLSPISHMVRLSELDITKTTITDLSDVRPVKSLSSLRIGKTPVVDLSGLAELEGLRHLNLDETHVADLAPLGTLKNLISIRLIGTLVSDLKPLLASIGLKSLIANGTPLANITDVERLTQLNSLFLAKTKVTDLSPLRGLASLTSLNAGCTRVADFAVLSELTNLNKLLLYGTQIQDLSSIGSLHGLTMLWISDTHVRDLSPLSGLPDLKWLNLSGTGVIDVSPLRRVQTLSDIDLSRTGVTDVAPLRDIAALESVDLRGAPVSDLSSLSEMAIKITILPNQRIKVSSQHKYVIERCEQQD